MSANEHVSKYQFYRSQRMYGRSPTHEYEVHKGDYRVAEMGVGEYSIPHQGVEHEVSALYVDEEHRHVMPTLLGIAHNYAQQQGAKLVPSHSLSPYSSAVVKNLKGRGLVSERHDDVATNEADFGSSRMQYRGGESEGTRLNTAEVDAGRQTIRQAIKSRPKRR